MVNGGKEPYPDDMEEGNPSDGDTDDIVIRFNEATLQRANEALSETEDPAEETYLEALITVFQYHQDPTFDEPLI